jgi:predicted DNA-binding transcriptional regulator YafY
MIHVNGNTDRLHRDIVKAMRLRRPVTVSYTRANGSETVRTIEPFMITRNKDGAPYVRVMDRESGEARTFRLDRISAYTVGGNKSRHLLEVPESKPKSGVPTKAETQRATAYAAADRPTPETVRQVAEHGARVFPVGPIAVRHLSEKAGA